MNRLKELRMKAGITQAQLANYLYVKQSTYSNWERGAIRPSVDTLEKLSELYQVPIDYILGKSDTPYQLQRPKPTTSHSEWIPIVGRIQAGTPTEAIEEVPSPDDLDEWEEINTDVYHGDFVALRIRGASMEPKFSEGDVVIVRRQPDVESGDIAVVLVNGEEGTVKKIKKDILGLYLIPTNPAFETRFFTNHEVASLPVKIFGKVVELRAKF